MKVYYITIFLTIVFCILAQRYDYKVIKIDSKGQYRHTRLTKSFYIIAATILVFVAGMRYAVGTDYFSYSLNYVKYAEEFWEHLKSLNEPAFRFICWLSVELGGDSATVIFVSAAITVALFLVVIYRNTNQIVMATMLFVFLGCWHGCFNGIRQYLAAAIVFAGTRYIKQRDLRKYCIFVFVGFLFHSSAILMLFAYFIVHNKINLFSIFVMIAGSFTILVSFDKVMSWTSVLLDTEYTESNVYLIQSVNSLRILVAIIPAVFFLIMYNNRLSNEKYRFWINCLILNAVMMFATSNSTYLARMGIYTAPFSTLAIPELIKGLSNNNRRIASFIIVLAYAVFWWYEVSHSGALNNFQFIWQI